MLSRVGTFISSSAATGEGRFLAATLLRNETDGLAIDFTDMSMAIKDTATPANAFLGNANSKLTYSSPSTKWILGSNGLYSSGTTLRTEYSTSGVALGLRIEKQRTNVVPQNRDMTNAVWTKTSVTAAKDQTGIDGIANSASSLTATAGNGTCLQAITLGSSARFQTAFVKRITGSGVVQMTMDNGTTWTAITVTASWSRVEIPTQTLANPTVGFRIVTSGDAIAVDFVQNENGTYATSPMEVAGTTGTTTTRVADNISIATSLIPYVAQPGSFFAKYVLFGLDSTQVSSVASLFADASNFVHMYANNTVGGRDFTASVAGASQGFLSIAGAAVGTTVKQSAAWATNDAAHVINGSAPVTDATFTLPTATSFRIGYQGAAESLTGHLVQIMYRPRRVSNADMQTETA